jgi:oligopeptide transport system permease protein
MAELAKIDFEPLVRSAEHIQAENEEAALGYWQDAWIRLKRDKVAMLGLGTIIFLLIVAIFGPMLSSVSYADQTLAAANQGPSAAHWFGTDNLGRDLFIRVLYGARISLSIGIVASLLNFLIGVTYGGIAGFMGGRVDRIMMNIVDVLYSIPVLLYVILLMVVLKPGLTNIFIALGIGYWLQMARIVRGQILSMKEQEFVLAARTIGASRRRILIKHLIPNAIGAIVVTLSLCIPDAIFTEAFLSFIGLGVSAPMASWGVLASEGVTSLKAYPFQLFFPAIAISVTMLAFNFLSDGLRDVLDPKMRR